MPMPPAPLPEAVVRRWRAEVRRAATAVPDDLAEELALHVAQRWQDARSAGHTVADADAIARRDLAPWRDAAAPSAGTAADPAAAPPHATSSILPAATPARSPWRRLMRWHDWTRDLRHAFRALRRTPGFTLTAVGTLALAIGVTAGLFAVVDKVLLDPLPFANPDRLVYIAGSAPGSDLPDEFGVSAEFLVQYREQATLLEGLSTFNSFTSTLRVGDRVERIRMSQPTSTLFTTLGATPVLGRLPVDADDDDVAVISDRLWQTWFDRDPGIVGRVAYISGRNRQIVGVMGPEFRFPDDGTLLWMSSRVREEGLVPGRFGMRLVGRMAPGADPAQVATELDTLARGLPARFGGSAAYARVIGQFHAIVRPLDEAMLGGVARPLWILFGSVAIVFVIACANVANLFMVRAETRQRDLALRRAIGAGRGQLVRLQLAEALVVAAAAGVLAVGLAALTMPVFLRAAPAGIPRIEDVTLTARTLLFTLGVAALAALACGLVPALRASRPDFARLRDGARGTTRARRWTRHGLVAAQTALALVLLIGSGLLLRSFWALRHVDPGYDTRDVFTFQIAPEGPHLNDGPTYARFDLDFMDRLRALPGVESVGLVENVPLNESPATVRLRSEGRPDAPDGTLVGLTFAAGDYFQTMRIERLAGRTFEEADHLSGRPQVILSRTAARALFPDGDAIGRRVQIVGQTTWDTVIGVVDDVLQNDFRETPAPLTYYPLVGPTPASWAISSPAYVVRTPRASTIAGDIRRLAHEVAPEAPMYRAYTMDQLAADSMVSVSFTMLTLGVAAGLALVLGAVGLYGVLSYVVAQRTREIGVRLALGARERDVRWMVVSQGARVVLLGIAIGVAVAVAATRALGSLLFDVAAVDAATFVAMSASMLAVGLVASYVPAWRASKVDPIVSLRGE